jgi:predicted GTPase
LKTVPHFPRNSIKLWWSLVLALLSVPYLILFTTGSIWLFQYHLVWQWLVISGVSTLAGWGLARWLRKKDLLGRAMPATPAPTWPDSGQQAWQVVDKIARRVQDEDLPLDQPQRLWAVVREVLDAVARQYHPKSKQATLETPVPDVLRIIELVAHDLREALAEQVPGAHILTLHDFRRLHHLAAWARRLYFLYKVAIFGVNPVAGLLREMRDAAGDRFVGDSGGEVKRWAVGFCVRKTGYYAIQLYSGHLALDDLQRQQYQTPQSRGDAQQAAGQQDRLSEEPLRILVVGQVKSGKSSLINALFGEVRAAVDVVPRTRQVEPYMLEREGSPRAIVLDTAGYDSGQEGPAVFEPLREAILTADLLLLACSAGSAARGADRRLLDEIRGFYQGQPDRIMPPLVVALTHVDQLRPRDEWHPPYNLAQPDGEKARQMAEAVLAVAEDLALAADQLVIPVCLRPDALYNVEEGLAPAILESVPEAQRVKCLRCLRQYHKDQYWRRLWRQGVQSGRVLLRAGAKWLSDNRRQPEEGHGSKTDETRIP